MTAEERRERADLKDELRFYEREVNALHDRLNEVRSLLYRQHMRLIQVAGASPDPLTREVLAEARTVIDTWGEQAPPDEATHLTTGPDAEETNQ